MRRVAKCVLVLGTVAAAMGASSDWLAAHGCDFWRYSTYRAELIEGTTASEQLSHRLEASEERLSLKERVVVDFVEGRTSFTAVVDLFQQANVGNDSFAQYMHSRYPAADDRELAARNAIVFITAALPKDSPRHGQVLSQVRAEFDRRYPHAQGPTT